MKSLVKAVRPCSTLKVAPTPSQQRCRSLSLATQTVQNSTTTAASSLIDDFTRFCYQRDLPNAINAITRLQNHGVRADSSAYSQLIKCCIDSRAIQHAGLIHRHLFSFGSYSNPPETFLINNLLNMYVKFGLLDEARQLFDAMPEPNVVSWTTMISAYTSCNFHERALQLFTMMHRAGVRANMYTFSSILRACDGLNSLQQLHCSILKNGLESDVFVRSALIDIYAKWGELNNGFRVFDEMVTKDVVVWNSVIAAFAQNNDSDEAVHLFKRMKRAGFSSDQGTLSSVLRACTGLVQLELGRQVHAHVLKFERDLILNNAILDMYCKCGNLDDANSGFQRMSQRDVISWSTMIAGFAQNGRSQEALQLFGLMKDSGLKPNYVTMIGVLFACSHAGLVEDGWNHFQSMKTLYGIEPGLEHHGCMVDILGRAGKLDEAVKFIHQMQCAPDSITWRTLLGACRVHQNADLAAYAAKQLLCLKPDDGGAYVLLSNIYADSRRWEDAEEVRNAMRGRRVRKEPGCSWIEVDKQIHAFIQGDKSHPQTNDISSEVNRLIQRIMEVGYIPDTKFVLRDVEYEQKEDSLRYHSEKLAIAFALMNSLKEKPIRIMKNLRICGDCHTFAKLVTKTEHRIIIIRDAIRFHHFKDGACSCADYW